MAPLHALAVLVLSLYVVASRAQSSPTFSLPWGIWQAATSGANTDVYTFKDVRFGQAPTSKLRFMIPQYPTSVTSPTVITTSGAACLAVPKPTTCMACPTSSTSSTSATLAPSPAASPGFGGSLPETSTGQSEDCLFADVYVPASVANNPNASVPVVVWLYGGAYIFGAKDNTQDLPFYDGTGLLRMAHSFNNDVIFVVGNYRLGAFGWLAGPQMHANGAYANLGLYDQNLLIQFVNDYISRVGGDPSRIGLWGESAGAGSIMYHLTSNLNQQPPYSRVLMQSPAYMWQWDPTDRGYAHDIYEALAENCTCTNSNATEEFSCLQSIDADELNRCNQNIVFNEWYCNGLIPFGPAVDGVLINDLPAVAFQKGNFHKSVSSFTISHVADESSLFVPCFVNETDGFSQFLNAFLPPDKYQAEQDQINQHYTNPNQQQRAAQVIGDSSFYCNTRWAYDAYASVGGIGLYMIRYAFGALIDAAKHATDLPPTFWSSTIDESALEQALENAGVSSSAATAYVATQLPKLGAEYQRYLAPFAYSGAPGPYQTGFFKLPAWNSATVDSASGDLTNVMEARWGGLPFADFKSPTTDTQNPSGTCSFWKSIAQSVASATSASTAGPIATNPPKLLLQDQMFKGEI